MTRLQLRPVVRHARERLAEGRDMIRRQHDSGSPGIQVCAHLADLFDGVVLDIFADAVRERAEEGDGDLESFVSLVAHGGYGRRDVAPFSDVDLMLLYDPSVHQRVGPLAQRLMLDIGDSGLELGFSTRTPAQGCHDAWDNVKIFTSLAESRLVFGSAGLFREFFSGLRRGARWRRSWLIPQIAAERRAERRKFGETVYLLRPNIKKSRGGLRDIHFMRWVGFARFGEVEPSSLRLAGKISDRDALQLREAHEFLLRMRNEMHFKAGRPVDGLDRSEQRRLAELFRYNGEEGVLPVESYMRDYYRHTSEVRNVVAHFVDGATQPNAFVRFLAGMFSHSVEGDFRVDPWHITATARGLEKVRADLAQVLRLFDLANRYDRRIAHDTWRDVREAMIEEPRTTINHETAKRFLSLLSEPARLGPLLRRLHEVRALENIVPGLSHARCLMQFNDYHKYTVDEHCIRTVDELTSFCHDDGVLGEAYQSIQDKSILHLAALMHDLGKGFDEDHSEVGRRLAGDAARKLRLSPRQKETLQFLVHKHLRLSHLAQRRNIKDPTVIAEFAGEMGTPDRLRMLYLLTCADLAAVGPGELNAWRMELFTELYQRTFRQMAGVSTTDRRLKDRREKVRLAGLGREEDPWWLPHVEDLPPGYVIGNRAENIVAELDRLGKLAPRDVDAWGRYLPDAEVVEYTVAAHENVAPGIFHRLTGALAKTRQRILSAEINTLADSMLIDRFYVEDRDFNGEPPPDRMEEVSRELARALQDESYAPPVFAETWRPSDDEDKPNTMETRVRCDNTTNDRYTIIDVYATDRTGLLFDITGALYAAGLQVKVAKIGTYLDQVVDAFYVTDATGNKASDRSLDDIRQRIFEAVEQRQHA